MCRNRENRDRVYMTGGLGRAVPEGDPLRVGSVLGMGRWVGTVLC